MPLANAPASYVASSEADVSHLDLIDDVWGSKLGGKLRALYQAGMTPETRSGGFGQGSGEEYAKTFQHSGKVIKAIPWVVLSVEVTAVFEAPESYGDRLSWDTVRVSESGHTAPQLLQRPPPNPPV